MRDGAATLSGESIHVEGADALSGGEHSARIAELLVATGLLTVEQANVVRSRASGGMPVPQALIREGFADDEKVAGVLAARFGLPVVDIGELALPAEARDALPLRVLERVVALPIAVENGRLRVAVADPSDVQGIDELRLMTRHSLELVVARRGDLQDALRRLARATRAFAARAFEEEAAEELVEEDDLEADDGISDGPLVRLVNSILFQAAEDGASDVHFEPHEDALAVRFRVDGVLHEVQRVPKRMAPGVVTRLKVLAKLDIADRRRPQDGRISLNAQAAGRLLDMRVATLPTVEGESVVIRLVDKSREQPTLETLGLSDEMRAQLADIVKKPTGALLVTGPTGSGKSTTLYAALAAINRPEINIITVEDPVEHRIPGINQVQINAKAGLAFATVLRSILRADPDVVMVGEIRDAETAKISIEAALTGHMVLSTLHTNDAPGALTRLNDMGVESFVTASAVSAVLAQRLARKLCAHCAEMYTPSREELAAARVTAEDLAAVDGTAFYRRKGCPRCNRTGYRGRVGVFQLLRMSEGLEALAAARASREEIARAAAAEGMRTLWDDGLKKVATGLTSLEELARVVS